MRPLNKPIKVGKLWYKVCNKCKLSHPLDNYYKSSRIKSGKRGDCKFCVAKTRKRWARRNYSPSKEKNKDLKRRYNISLSEYNELVRKQEGCCEICGVHESKLTRSLHVDHNHKTGEIRGLLCLQCNKLLGYANDDVIYLLGCVDYLNGLRRMRKDAEAK